jgi:Flp pilus assembly protein TadD
VRSAERQKVWRDNPTFFAQLLEDAPLSYRAHWARGAYLFDAGNKQEGEKELQLAIELFPHDPQLIEDLATRYLRAGFCGPAVPRFRQALEMAPERSAARVGLVACLLRDGDHRAAAAEARAGLRYGTDMNLVRLAQVADSLGGVAH